MGSFITPVWWGIDSSALGVVEATTKALCLNTKIVTAVCIAAFAGTYLGIWLQQVAVKFAVVGVALTLSNTSPLFLIPIAFCLGERISLRTILGVFIAIGGVAVLLLR